MFVNHAWANSAKSYTKRRSLLRAWIISYENNEANMMEKHWVRDNNFQLIWDQAPGAEYS